MFQEELNLLKLNRVSTIHPFVFCIYRFCLGFFMGILSTQSLCILTALVIQIGYLVYICINQPYKYRNLLVRSILNESSICVHLIVLIVYDYKLTSEYTSLHNSSTALVWIDLIVTVGATVLSAYCLVLSIRNQDKSVTSVSN